MPRGSALGMVTQLPSDDETSISKKQLLARLDVCMGGRVAEEIIFGQDQITTGASSDLHTATELAQYMVSFCFVINGQVQFLHLWKYGLFSATEAIKISAPQYFFYCNYLERSQ